MRDPDIPTKPGWYRCLLARSFSRPERWGAIEVVEEHGRLTAIYLGTPDVELDATGFLKWGDRIAMPDDAQERTEPQI